MGKIGLVLEGGGMRGAYTAGVLYWLLENDLHFDYVVGISSGALYSGMYALNRKETLKVSSTHYAADDRNVGIKSILREGTLVGYNHMFNSIRKELDYPLDQMDEIPGEIEIGVYDIAAEETVWKNKKDIATHPEYVQAACTLPVAGRAVTIEGRKYMDGGITTMIPLKRSIEMGCDKHFVVTTKSKEFVRKPQGFWMKTLLNTVYRKYPRLVADFDNRVNVYYDERKLIDELVAKEKALYLYPSKETGVSRYSGSVEQFETLFETGRADCEAIKDDIIAFYKSVKG